jgi:hypothetical protein
MNNCPAERLFLFCQAVRNGIMNQFAGSIHADLFQDASTVCSHRVCTQMDGIINKREKIKTIIENGFRIRIKSENDGAL